MKLADEAISLCQDFRAVLNQTSFSRYLRWTLRLAFPPGYLISDNFSAVDGHHATRASANLSAKFAHHVRASLSRNRSLRNQVHRLS